MKNGSEWIYLLTSNGSERYMTDALETIAFPPGTVQHFRYQTKWVSKRISNQLPIEGKSVLEDNMKRDVLVCYLFQPTEDNEKEAIYPLRKAKLIDANKTGSSDRDIVHFYFKLADYVLCDESEEFINFKNEILKEHNTESTGKKFVFFKKAVDPKYIAQKGKDNTATFNKICNELGIEIFKSLDGKQKYFPIFSRIEDFKKNDGTVLEPEYDPHTYKSYYEFKEAEKYTFKFSTYFLQEWSKFLITIGSRGKIFSTPELYEFEVASRYDEVSYFFIPNLLDRETWTSIIFQTKAKKNKSKKINPLNLSVNFLVKVKINSKYRFIENLNPLLAFGFSAAVMVLVTLISGKWIWWYLIVIIPYVTYLVLAVMLLFMDIKRRRV